MFILQFFYPLKINESLFVTCEQGWGGNIVDNAVFVILLNTFSKLRCEQTFKTSPNFCCNSGVQFHMTLLTTVVFQFIQIQQSKPLKHRKAGNQVKSPQLCGVCSVRTFHMYLGVCLASTLLFYMHIDVSIVKYVLIYIYVIICIYNIKIQLCCHCQILSKSNRKVFIGTQFCLFI